jgi:uncharacterized protein (TIGR01777 family)
MKIAISGSNGLIGRHLIESLKRSNHQIICIDRLFLSPDKKEKLCSIIESSDVIVNLAGASINQKWSNEGKKTILESRINSTRALVDAINHLKHKPKTFISASAIGAYEIDSICDESETGYGTNFLADVCRKWEAEAKKVSSDVRLVIPRFGVVLAADGGAFPKMVQLFRFYLGGKIATGQQGFSWIHIDDAVSIIEFLINTPKAEGIINITVPQSTDNQMLTNALSSQLRKPSWVSTPRFLLRLILGEREMLITQGQKIYPGKLYNLGYQFKFSTIDSAVLDLHHKY